MPASVNPCAALSAASFAVIPDAVDVDRSFGIGAKPVAESFSAANFAAAESALASASAKAFAAAASAAAGAPPVPLAAGDGNVAGVIILRSCSKRSAASGEYASSNQVQSAFNSDIVSPRQGCQHLELLAHHGST